MNLSKGIRAQEGIPVCITKWIPDNKSGLNSPQKINIVFQISRSALSGDLRGVSLQLNLRTHDKCLSLDTQGPYRNTKVGYVTVTNSLNLHKNACGYHVT